MAEIVRLCIPFISVVNSLNFAFVFACWQTNTVTINAEPTKKTEEGKPVGSETVTVLFTV